MVSIEECKEAAELYLDGYKYQDICRMLDIKRADIYYRLRKLGIKGNRYANPNKEEVVELFDQGLSLVDIAKKLGADISVISRLVRSEGRNPQEYGRLNKVNFNPFLDLSNADVQYWLGYICADGCVYRNQVRIYTNLDPDHLEAYKEFIGRDLNIQSHLNRHSSYNYCAQFNNRDVVKYLIGLGITPNKSLTLELKTPITFPMLRGMWDGDGSVVGRSKYYVEPSLVTASGALYTQVCKFLENGQIGYRSSYCKGMYQITINKTGNVKNFYNKLYKDGKYFLPRKKDKYLSMLNKDIV